ncbi:sugar transferase [Pontivivens ytuae]|nr:sugar transferase [Pontivivens ytuae]
MLLLWALARLDGGRGLFGHDRVGRDGKVFKCWKFRSMRVDANDALQKHLKGNPAAAAEWRNVRKLAYDPRITPIGRIMRKYSLDELPQFWNVLRGDMSLIGPRPVCLDELPRYGRAATLYLSVRPGLTGLWQVSGRNALSYAQRVVLDVEYCNRMDALLDLRICLATVRVVIAGHGR